MCAGQLQPGMSYIWHEITLRKIRSTRRVFWHYIRSSMHSGLRAPYRTSWRLGSGPVDPCITCKCSDRPHPAKLLRHPGTLTVEKSGESLTLSLACLVHPSWQLRPHSRRCHLIVLRKDSSLIPTATLNKVIQLSTEPQNPSFFHANILGGVHPSLPRPSISRW